MSTISEEILAVTHSYPFFRGMFGSGTPSGIRICPRRCSFMFIPSNMAASVGIIDTNLVDLVVWDTVVKTDSMCIDTSPSVKTEQLLVCSCARHGKRSCRAQGPEEKAPRNSSPTNANETPFNLGCLQILNMKPVWRHVETIWDHDKPGIIQVKLSTYWPTHVVISQESPEKAQAGLSQVLQCIF